jgi:hypothetical protein
VDKHAVQGGLSNPTQSRLLHLLIVSSFVSESLEVSQFHTTYCPA